MSAQFFPMEPVAPSRHREICSWTDQDIDTLYEGLMFRSMQQLFNAHSSVELRCDVNAWIFDASCVLLRSLLPLVARGSRGSA